MRACACPLCSGPVRAQECKTVDQLSTVEWRDVRLNVPVLLRAQQVDLSHAPLRDDGLIVAAALLKV